MHKKKYVWITLEVLRQAAEKCPAAFEATRAPLHYVYNCSVLKATFHVSCEAEQHCDPPVWASSLSDINANHCSQSINTERKVQFTSDPLLTSEMEVSLGILFLKKQPFLDSFRTWVLFRASFGRCTLTPNLDRPVPGEGRQISCVDFRLTGWTAADRKDKPLLLFGSFCMLLTGQRGQRSALCFS